MRKFDFFEKDDDFNKCEEHDLKMHYYCQTCSKIICSDCVMFEDLHKTHEIKKMRE